MFSDMNYDIGECKCNGIYTLCNMCTAIRIHTYLYLHKPYELLFYAFTVPILFRTSRFFICPFRVCKQYRNNNNKKKKKKKNDTKKKQVV